MPLKLVPPRNDKRQSSPNWRIRGTYLSTKVDQTSGTASKKIAAQELDRIQREIEGNRYGKTAPVDFLTAAISYLEAGGDGTFVDRLKDYFGELHLDAIDQAALDKAATTLYPQGTPATRNRAVYTPVSAILKHAGIEKKLKRPKGARGESRLAWLKPEEAFALLAAAKARIAAAELALEEAPRQFKGARRAGVRAAGRFYALCVFLLYTGCRLSEALRVRPQDLELSRSFAYVGKTKNGQPRPVHLPPEAVAALANIEFGRTRVFGVASKCGRLYTALKETAKAAGVKIPDRVAFHIFRHTYGAWMRRYGGLDTSGLVATGAWRSRQAAAVYEHVDASEEAQKADLLPTPRVKSV